MKIYLDFGAGIKKFVSKKEQQNRDIVPSDINPEDVIETVKIVFTVLEAVKILIQSIKNIFKK